METSTPPCLVEKALTMLVSMGNSGRPKSLKKLENVLRSCTMVAPYVDPLEVLKAANRMSACPEPPVLNVQHNQSRVYYTPHKHIGDQEFQKSVPKNAKKMERDFDVAVPGGEIEAEITQGVLAWLREWDKHEGTQQQLEQELYQRCQMEVDRSPLDVILKLQSRGLLKVEGENVTYSLPDFSGEQSQVLEALHNSSDAKCIDGLFQLSQSCSYFNKDVNILMWYLLGTVYPMVYPTLLDSNSIAFSDINWVSNHNEEPPESCDLYDETEDATPCTVPGDGLEDILRDTLVAYSLFCVPPEDRPSSLKDLLNLVKPQRLTFAVLPSKALLSNLSQVKQRQAKKTERRVRGRRHTCRQGKTEILIGIAVGEITAQELIPLTPEGLLGIDFHIAHCQSPDPESCASPSEPAIPMDTSPTWLLRDKPRANGTSKEFARALSAQLLSRAKYHNAVPIPASQSEKEEAVSRVLEWVNSHHQPADGGQNKLKSIKQLQNELIKLCVIRTRRIAPGSIVRCLQRSGYVSIHAGESPEVTYNIPLPAAKTCPPAGPVGKNEGMTPWQQHAEEFRQSVSRCYVTYFKQAFPPEICKPSVKRQKFRSKRKRVRGMIDFEANKEQKYC